MVAIFLKIVCALRFVRMGGKPLSTIMGCRKITGRIEDGDNVWNNHV